MFLPRSQQQLQCVVKSKEADFSEAGSSSLTGSKNALWSEARWGSDGFKGLKESYEDRVSVEPMMGLGLGWGLFDGHGGINGAEFVAREMWMRIANRGAERVSDFSQVLDRRRADLVRSCVAAVPKRSVEERPNGTERVDLERIELAAGNIETALRNVKSYSYGAVEHLVELQRRLESRKTWLDAASVARKGGGDSRRALSWVLDTEKAEREAIERSEAEASRSASVELSDEDWKAVLIDVFRDLDTDFLELAERKNWNDGTCALCALLVDDSTSKTGKKLVVANAGDSRAILLRDRTIIKASVEHKPTAAAEKRRVERAGGYVVNVGGAYRVTSPAGVGYGIDRSRKSLYLSVSRAIGDRQLKKPTPVLVADPDTKIFKLQPTDRLLVLVSDGVTDALADRSIIHLAVSDEDPDKAAKLIVMEAFSKGAADNVTALVVRFPWTDHETLAKTWAQPPAPLDTHVQTQPELPTTLHDTAIDIFAGGPAGAPPPKASLPLSSSRRPEPSVDIFA